MNAPGAARIVHGESIVFIAGGMLTVACCRRIALVLTVAKSVPDWVVTGPPDGTRDRRLYLEGNTNARKAFPGLVPR